MKFAKTTLAMAISAAALLVAWPQTAQACGGFFCNNMSMDQTGEQIVFGVDGPTVTATIQIAFSGDAEDFGWVIPVAQPPEISLAPRAIFSTLGGNTQPYHWLQWDYTNTGSCMNWPVADFQEATPNAGGGGTKGVNIIDSGEVGPYETVTLESDDAEALFEWLNDNGFVQPEEVQPLIEHYLDLHFMFVAMKLKQGTGTGEIQPVTLAFTESEPCVPLVLTQIAAQPDMPVLIWALSETQAVPRNWFKVEVNEKKINWMANGSNYIELVTLAIDEAAGHGFVTEFAGALDMDGWLYKEGQYDTKAMKGLSVAAFLDAIQSQGFPRDSQLLELLKKYIPMPSEGLPSECQDEDSFYNWNIYTCVGYMPSDWMFDSEAFADDLEERVVQPMKDAQDILDRHDYVTRMYSTVSPDEMNRDPMFHFNADLEDVSNQHTAEGTATCNEDGSVSDVVITLQNGESFTLEGSFQDWWGWMSDEEYGDPAPDEGAASSIALVGPEGQPVEVAPSDVKTIDARLDDEDPSVVLADLIAGVIDSSGTPATDPSEPPDPTGPADPTEPTDPSAPAASGGGDDGGCGGAGGSAPLWPAALALLALGIMRRR